MTTAAITDRATRFPRTFVKLGLTEADSPAGISEQFTDILPKKSAVFPYTHEVLDYLKLNYRLHLITNGFNAGWPWSSTMIWNASWRRETLA